MLIDISFVYSNNSSFYFSYSLFSFHYRTYSDDDMIECVVIRLNELRNVSHRKESP